MRECRELAEVGAVLDGICRIVTSGRLPGPQQRQWDRCCSNTSELASLTRERLTRPHEWSVWERQDDSGRLVGDHEGELHQDAVQCVAGSENIVLHRRVLPAGGGQRGVDGLVIVPPDDEVDVVMIARHTPHTEVDRPPAEQPMRDPLLLEDGAQAADRGELTPRRSPSYVAGHLDQRTV